MTNNRIIRNNPSLLRNEYSCTKENGFPILRKQEIPPIDEMISCCDARYGKFMVNAIAYLVHFFKEDNRFDFLYDKPDDERAYKMMKYLAPFSAICSPDFSLYSSMPLPVQKFQIFKSRWCGARWQSLGFLVVPTVTWADERSFEFCFEGLPQHATVAVSTVGCNRSKAEFLLGYSKMLEVLQPELIFCYGNAFDGMEGNVLVYPYEAFHGKVGA